MRTKGPSVPTHEGLFAFENLETYALAAIGAAQGAFKYYRPAPPQPATLAWGALIAGVVAYDALCPPHQTMSEGYDDFVEDHPVISRVAAFTVAAHLTNLIPKKYDPLHRLTTWKR